MDGVTGCLKSVSPGSMESDGLSKSMSMPSKPYSVTMRVTEETKFGTRFGIGEREVLAAAAEGDHHLLALALQPGDVGLELFGVEAGGRAELHGPFRRIPIRRGEGDDDDVPLRRDFAQRDGGARPAVTGPVADKPVAVGRAAQRDCRDRWLRRRGRPPPRPPRAGQGLAGSVSACASGKAVSAAEPSEAPVYQGSSATFCR